MFGNALALSSTRWITNTVGILISSGMLVLLALVQEWAVFGLSIVALACQGVALLLVLAYRLWQRSRRLLAYPIILFCTVYLWENRLPPPSLPDGWLRSLLPVVVIGVLMLDYAYARMQRAQHARATANRIAALSGFIPLDEAAYLFRMSPKVLKARLQTAQSAPLMVLNGQEYVAFTDLRHVVAQRPDELFS